MSTNDILLRHLDDNGILKLTLNDEPRRNALSEGMLEKLGAAFLEAGNDPAIRVIILTANGGTFCAGHDLKELTAARSENKSVQDYFAKIMRLCSGVMQSIVNCPKPVIAEVQGVATAAGCQLVASCDLAIAADTARFATPGVHIGLFCSTPMVALSRNVSHKHAMEMLLTGDMTSAMRAEQIGLVNKVVTLEVLGSAVLEMAQKIAAKSSMTLATGKTAFYRQSQMTLSEAYDYTSRIMVENLMARDAEEGIQAFLTKRDPKWEDR